MIFSSIEHHAVLNCIPALKKAGFEITQIGVDPWGRVSMEELKAACRQDTILVAVMYVNNEVGTIEPIAEIGQLCRERNILLHVDGVAAAGHLPVHVKELGAGMFSLSAHKFRGPRGIGALYVDKKIPVANMMFGGSQERTKRPGTQNVPGAAAMAQGTVRQCGNYGGTDAEAGTSAETSSGWLAGCRRNVVERSFRKQDSGNCKSGI